MKFVIRKNTKEPNHKNHGSFPAAAGRLSMAVKLNPKMDFEGNTIKSEVRGEKKEVKYGRFRLVLAITRLVTNTSNGLVLTSGAGCEGS
jgi:hypothetical protein